MKNFHAPAMRVGDTYMIATTDDMSLIADYAGADGDVCVFNAGPFPIRIPAVKIDHVECLSEGGPNAAEHARRTPYP